jgi:hypothetical protein
MRFVVAVAVLAIGCSGEQGDQGTVGEQGPQGEMGMAGAQGSAGPEGEKGPPGSHVQYVDGSGTPIDRFAYVQLPSLPPMPVVFDDDNLMWPVTMDPTTLVVTIAAYTSPFPVLYYTGANCTGDMIVSYTGQPKNMPFRQGDTMNRLYPATAATQIASASQDFFGTCQAQTATVTGYLIQDTVPATPINPPAVTWSGPIEARWVD